MSLFKCIAERCKKEQAPNRELDAIIAIARSWQFGSGVLTLHDQTAQELQPWFKKVYWYPHWYSPAGISKPYFMYNTDLPFFTASEDAANLVLPKGYVCTAGTDFELPGMCKLFDGNDTLVSVQANSPVYAKLAASFMVYHIEEERKNGRPSPD